MRAMKHGPRCPRCDGAPSGPTIEILREVIRDLEAELTEPSALGVDRVIAQHIRERLVSVASALRPEAA